MSEEKKTRVFWIRPEGISKVCRYFPAVYTEVDLKYATNREFVLEGIHVIEYSAYQVLQKENDELKSLAKQLCWSLINEFDVADAEVGKKALTEYKQWKEKNETT